MSTHDIAATRGRAGWRKIGLGIAAGLVATATTVGLTTLTGASGNPEADAATSAWNGIKIDWNVGSIDPGSYGRMLWTLRQNLGGSREVKGTNDQNQAIYTLTNRGLIQIRANLAGGKVLRLFVNPGHDAYIDGFARKGGTIYQAKDYDVAGAYGATAKKCKQTFNFDYGKVGRPDTIRPSSSDLKQALNTLYDAAPDLGNKNAGCKDINDNAQRALSIIAVGVAEAARFSYVERNIASERKLDTKGSTLINQWSNLSACAARMTGQLKEGIDTGYRNADCAKVNIYDYKTWKTLSADLKLRKP